MTEVVARLAPGASLATAGSEVSAVFSRLQRDHPAAYDPAARPRVEVVPFKKAIGEQAELPLWLLMGAAAFVLIIAVANVANLTLMRNVRREQELVIRSALGAGAARLRRLLLTENMVLAFLGAGIGVLVAVAGVPLLVSLAARYSPRANEIELDATVLAFTLVLAVGAALFFSLVAPLPAEGTLAPAASVGRPYHRRTAQAAAAARARRRPGRRVGRAARGRRTPHAHDAAPRRCANGFAD